MLEVRAFTVFVHFYMFGTGYSFLHSLIFLANEITVSKCKIHVMLKLTVQAFTQRSLS